MEGFKECIPDGIKTYLEERNVTTVYEMATLDDEYALMHKRSKQKYSGSFELGSGPGLRSGSSSDPSSMSDRSYSPVRPFKSYKSTNTKSRDTNSQRFNSHS